jgi:dynein heavy chain
MHILRRFYNEAITPEPEDEDLDEKGKLIREPEVNFKLSESGIYRIFHHHSIEEILTYIDTLPPTEDPEVFGLHPNANIAFQLQESEKIISCVLNVQPRVSTGSSSTENKSVDDIIYELAQ